MEPRYCPSAVDYGLASNQSSTAKTTTGAVTTRWIQSVALRHGKPHPDQGAEHVAGAQRQPERPVHRAARGEDGQRQHA